MSTKGIRDGWASEDHGIFFAILVWFRFVRSKLKNDIFSIRFIAIQEKPEPFSLGTKTGTQTKNLYMNGACHPKKINSCRNIAFGVFQLEQSALISEKEIIRDFQFWNSLFPQIEKLCTIMKRCKGAGAG